MKRLIGLLLIFTLLLGLLSPLATAVSAVAYGDLSGDGRSSSEDALMVLKSVVGKLVLTEEQKQAADVDANQKVNSADALMILQRVVGKIERYPAEEINSMSEEEQFYHQLNQQYKATFDDFGDLVEVGSDLDPAELVEKLGGDPETAPVAGYQVSPELKLSYTPLSNEARRKGELSLYNTANKVGGTIQNGTTSLTYTLPKTVTAYDVIPIQYSVHSTSQKLPVHFEATAYEEATRLGKQNCYDANLPGTVNMALEYLGYVTADNVGGKPYLTPTTVGDIQGQQYPAYDASELIRSGTLKTGDYTWLKFKFTNTGNTVLDGEGNSAFRFAPHLYQYQGNGWVHVGDTLNLYYPLLDYVYPGESGEFWVLFNIGGNSQQFGMKPGNYKVVIDGHLRTESDTYNTNAMAIAGRAVTSSSFEFSVTDQGAQTQPRSVENSKGTVMSRNTWLSNFEEFMSSYTSLYQVGKNLNQATSGTMYLQVAPFTKQITLRLINGNADEIAMVSVPVTVNTDSVSITLNPYNNNYVVQNDGTRTPMIMTQNMVDMRGNIDRGPYTDDIIVNDLRNMKEAGINTLTTTHAYTGDYSGLYDMSMFMLDAARKMGFRLEGHALYPYRSTLATTRVRASDRTISLGSQRDMFNQVGVDASNGILAFWNLVRYGDMYHYDPVTKTVPIAIEENYGWMNSDLNCRFGIGNSYSDRLLWKWLEKAYDEDIAKLNRKYGSSFGAFKEISLSQQGGTPELDGLVLNNSSAVYHDWNAATMELDVFRTTERVRNYKEMLRAMNVPQAKIALRSENSIYMAGGISQTTDNAHYRYIYYEQRRAAAIPEIMAASGIVYSDSGYSAYAFTDREVYELTRQAAKTGFVTAKTPPFNHMYDPIITESMGNIAYSDYLSLGNADKLIMMKRNGSLFTYWKAMYEAGGIPGTMWMDYNCDLYVTTTQYKEMLFFKQKIAEMLATDEGKAWATSVPETATQSPIADVFTGVYSYPEAYIEEQLKTIPRINRITNLAG